MTALETWNNADGLIVRFGGEQGRRRERLGSLRTAGETKEFTQVINLAGPARTVYTIDATGAGTFNQFSDLDGHVITGGIILSARMVVNVAGAGGTSVSVDTFNQNGTVITTGGLITAAQGAVANLTLNNMITGTGPQINTRMNQDTYISVTTTGTFTAGQIQLYYTVLDARG